jgi:HNH endonuclease/Domain of unknown function (DUF222)
MGEQLQRIRAARASAGERFEAHQWRRCERPPRARYGGLIPDLTVQRLACDSTVTRVLLNAESAVIDVGRSQRVVHGATRRALNVRDKGCRWPGCDRPASWTAAHHIVHWVRGGRTDLDNLVLLCHRHHWMVHEAGFQLVRVDNGGDILTIPPPPGETYRPRPPN